MYTAPLVSSSSPARQCISVLLPEPDGPMIAVNLLRSNATVTPSRARTSLSPLPYTLVASTAPAAAVMVVVCSLMVNVVVPRRVPMQPIGSDDRPSARTADHLTAAQHRDRTVLADDDHGRTGVVEAVPPAGRVAHAAQPVDHRL